MRNQTTSRFIKSLQGLSNCRAGLIHSRSGWCARLFAFDSSLFFGLLGASQIPFGRVFEVLSEFGLQAIGQIFVTRFEGLCECVPVFMVFPSETGPLFVCRFFQYESYCSNVSLPLPPRFYPHPPNTRHHGTTSHRVFVASVRADALLHRGKVIERGFVQPHVCQ